MRNDQTMQRVGVIMAGGSGERFWPLSRRKRPKQLLRLTSETQTMLGEAVERIAPLVAAEHVYVVTGEHLVDPIREAGIGVPDENVIAEPCKRNTAGALMYAAAHLLAKYGGDGSNLSMAVTTADHLVGKPDLFVATLDAALSAAEREDALATLGVVPDRPETGYGYIQTEGDVLEGGSPGVDVFSVSAFHEKPNREQAEEFIATGRYFWNSGMFFWKVSTFLSEFDQARPEFAQITRDMAEAMGRGDDQAVRTSFEGLEDISIDYALMEHADRVLMARAEFPWDDVGAWPALERTYGSDDDGNVAIGDPVLVDVKDCIVYNDPGADAMAVGVVGVEDLVVVVTKDAVLVAPKDRAQDVKKVVTELKERGSGLV
ncbi:MAG: NTP transferase domain-containing protein [bacterium]|nr:NTP transferase domain-containing protein [bacterium]